MNQLDTHYRALTEYSKQTNSNRELVAFKEHLIETEPKKEELLVKRATCIIDEEWVNEIEKGLEHVEKAIKEERQFILSNGEVIPIEKVKHVSKHSIEHLARHSSLITRYEEGKDIVPDGLYTVEKLTDYTVYENKFLYMLLCYLRDFISIRYNAILDITNRYDGTLDVEREVSLPRRKLKYKISLEELKQDDEYLRTHNPAQKTIDKINLLLKAVIAYLATPLMQEVSKVAMIKPPIVKTNVLKMNNNFKGAVALYEYIVAYDKLGYTIEYKENLVRNFHGGLASDTAEVESLLSFIAYEYGLGLEEELKENYFNENERIKLEELEQRANQIKALKKRLANGQASPEEYILLIEKQIRALEGERSKINSLNAKVLELKELVRKLKLECEQLKERIFALEFEVKDIIDRHKERIENLNKKHQDEILEIRENYENQIEVINADYAKKISDIISEYETKVSLLKVECENTIDTLTAEYEDRLYKANKELDSLKANKDNSQIKEVENANLPANDELSEKTKAVTDDLDKKVNDLSNLYDGEVNFETLKCDGKLKTLYKDFKDKVDAINLKNKNQINTLNKNHEDEVDSLKQTIKANEDKFATKEKELQDRIKELHSIVVATANANDELSEQISLYKAKISSVRLEYGLSPNEDYNDKKSFDKLDKQFKAFKKYYKEKWDLVKQNSRKKFNEPNKEEKASEQPNKEQESTND